MSVQEQMPIVVYVANGNTNRFAITFDLHDQNYLVVTLNNEVAQVGSYSVLDGEVVFGTAPADGSLVTLYRDTQLNRTTNYKSYDNSFRPESVNWDFDKLWHVLQEQNLIDGKILARIKDEIEWRRTHDFNYDELAQVREKQLFDALKGYADTLYSATNPNVFAGVIAGVVFARDGKSIQTHIEEILDNLALSRSYVDGQLSLKAPQATTYNKIEVDTKIGAETTRAQAAEQVLQNQVNAVGVGNKAYLTYTEMDADKANNPVNSKLEVTNDPIDSNNGVWQWNGTTLTKSSFDPAGQAKVFATNEVFNATSMLHKTNNSNLHEYADSDGSIVAALNSTGEFEAQDFKTESGSLSAVTKAIWQQEVTGYTHAFVDNDGNIVFGIKQDGTIVGSSTAAGLSELRAGILSSDDMNAVGLNLDAKYLAETPLNYTVEVSPYGADETLHQRMPSAVQVSDTRLFVAFAQFSTAGTDGVDGRLVGRFIDFNLTNQTSTVSATQIIDGEQFGSLSRHPVFIKLKNKIVLIFNAGGDLIQMESVDNCQTWTNRRSIKITGFPAYLGLDTAVKIEHGEYAGRVCLATYVQDVIGVMYSDDDCQTWNAGGLLDGNIAFPATPDINEVSLALDSSQNLVLVMRHEDYTADKRYLLFATSKDGGQTIQPVGMNPKIPTSACQVGFKQFAPTIFNAVPKIIMSHPALRSFDRRMFRIRVSYDNCQTFISEYAPFSDTLDVAYSSICVLGNSKLALVYEEGQTNQNQSVKIKFLNLAEII